MSGKSAGQQAYEARQAAKARRMGAPDSEPDSTLVAIIGLRWEELPAGMKADEEAAATAVETGQLSLAREDRDQLRKQVLDLAAKFEGQGPGGVAHQLRKVAGPPS
jgi:hypothetical protein